MRKRHSHFEQLVSKLQHVMLNLKPGKKRSTKHIKKRRSVEPTNTPKHFNKRNKQLKLNLNSFRQFSILKNRKVYYI